MWLVAGKCPSGETGRHIGLKIRRFVNSGRAGSIPASGTSIKFQVVPRHPRTRTSPYESAGFLFQKVPCDVLTSQVFDGISVGIVEFQDTVKTGIPSKCQN